MSNNFFLVSVTDQRSATWLGLWSGVILAYVYAADQTINDCYFQGTASKARQGGFPRSEELRYIVQLRVLL